MRCLLSTTFRLVLLVGVLSLSGGSVGLAQPSRGTAQATVALESWPRSLPALLDEMGQDAPYLLPRIDSLALDYRYATTDTTSRWSFVLSWRPAERVLYEGTILPRQEAPRALRMTNVELRADVRVDGEKEAEMIIGVDSMALRALPDRFAFNVSVAHDRVFLNTPPDEARRLLREGITLDRLVVERMGFAAASVQRSGNSDRRPDARERRDEPSRPPSIYRPRTRVFIGWRIGPRPYYIGDDDGDGKGGRRTRRPRGETVGRTPTAEADRDQGADRDEGRTRGADGSDDEKGGRNGGEQSDTGASQSGEDEDDDDDTNLQAPALAAAAAVGLVAFAGGTVGLYGRGDTPLGLASGYTHPRGGVQVQAAVNREVLDDDPGQKLSIRALGFYDLLGARVQPAIGLGVMVDPDAGSDVEPAVSGGLVGNFGRIVLYGGIDVTRATPEVGLSYNFRYGRGGDD